MPVMECDLGEFICKQNIYGKMNLEAGWEINTAMETDSAGDTYASNWWYFDGKPRRVRKAMRIPYTYVDAKGNTVHEFLLVGYEGAGGP